MGQRSATHLKEPSNGGLHCADPPYKKVAQAALKVAGRTLLLAPVETTAIRADRDVENPGSQECLPSALMRL